MAGNCKLKFIHRWDPFIFLRATETIVLGYVGGKTYPEASERNQKGQTILVFITVCQNGAMML